MKLLFCLLALLPAATRAQSASADSLYTAARWKEAVAAYQVALRTDSGSALQWYRLGNSQLQVGNFSAAVEAYQHALRIKAGAVPPVFIRLAMAQSLTLGGKGAAALTLLDTMAHRGWSNFPELDTNAAFNTLRTDTAFIRIRNLARRNAFPCADDPAHRAFDFWIGEWIVYQTGTTTQVGRSHVDYASGGCLLLENWTATLGGPNEGKSLNFIDPATNTWKQVWVGSGGPPQEYTNGRYVNGAMRFENTGVDATGKPVQFHFSFFNNNGEVRQLLEQSADGGKTWTSLYDFTYRKN